MQGLPGEPDAADAQTVAYSHKWGEYMSSLAKRGALEAGAPLQPMGKAVSRDALADAPLSVPDIYGFMVVNAATLDGLLVRRRT